MSRTFRLDKLIRDGVFENMQAIGQDVDYRVLDTNERQSAYTDKTLEECLEFDETGDPSELADALQTLIDKAHAAGISFEELKRLQEKKLAALGGFSELVFVHTVTLEEGDDWVNYYENNPDRFPEVVED